MAAWINVLSLPGKWVGVITKSTDASPSYGIWINSANQWVFGSSLVNVTGSAVTLGWHHVAIVQDVAAGVRRIYVNGVLAGSANRVGAANGTGDLWFGGSKANTSQYFRGDIDDARIYNRALLGSEIQGLAASGPVGYWKFDEGSGTTTADSSGNGDTGTLGGSGVSWAPGQVGAGALSSRGPADSWTCPAAPRCSSPPRAELHRGGLGQRPQPAGQVGGRDHQVNRRLAVVRHLDQLGQPVGLRQLAGQRHGQRGHPRLASRGDRPGRRRRGPADMTSTASWRARPTGSAPPTAPATSGSEAPRRMPGSPSPAPSTTPASTTAPCPPPRIQVLATPGLVGYWRFDEGSGTTTADSSGNGDTGTLGGSGVSWAAGRVGPGALSFQGTGGRVVMSDSAALRFAAAKSFTVAAWINVLSLPGKWVGVITKLTDASPSYGIWINSANQWVFGSSLVNVTGSAVTLGWHHVAIVQDVAAGRRRIYVDGVLAGSASQVGAADGTGELWFGAAKAYPDQSFTGAIDDARIYNRALPASEIQKLATLP